MTTQKICWLIKQLHTEVRRIRPYHIHIHHVVSCRRRWLACHRKTGRTTVVGQTLHLYFPSIDLRVWTWVSILDHNCGSSRSNSQVQYNHEEPARHIFMKALPACLSACRMHHVYRRLLSLWLSLCLCLHACLPTSCLCCMYQIWQNYFAWINIWRGRLVWGMEEGSA